MSDFVVRRGSAEKIGGCLGPSSLPGQTDRVAVGKEPWHRFPGMDSRERTLRILSEVTDTQGRELPADYQLYDRGLMDSMTTVQLIAALSDEFGLDISPADFDREAWATPRMLVADIERRLQT